MQTTNAAFTAAEKSMSRSVAENIQISWHKQYLLANKTFTIGVSTIGGNDLIGINPGALGSPGNYKYFDESAYAMTMEWERGYNMPQGGLTMALGSATLDNTSKRFLPRYMGGNSELSTAIQLSRPVIMSAGFNINGASITIPQFSGQIYSQPQINVRDRTIQLQFADYVNYFANDYLDQATVFTGVRTDQALEGIFSQLGMTTAQYKLDTGINVIPVVFFDIGTQVSDAIGQLVEAENGQLYQDELGIFRFENRQHGLVSPGNTVQKILYTSDVIDQASPDASHLVNDVVVSGSPRAKQANAVIWQATDFAGSGSVTIAPNSTADVWITLSDPALSIDTPVGNGTPNQTSFFIANNAQDGSGTDFTNSVTVSAIAKFSTSCKITFRNSSGNTLYITNLDLWGRSAPRTGDVYYRSTLGASITAYGDQSLSISNDFIQTNDWAETYGEMILGDFGQPDQIQQITIRAKPDLQMGDLISWQGHYWRVYDIKTTVDPGQGFIQQLLIFQRTIKSYFRIGISTIGGTDIISP